MLHEFEIFTVYRLHLPKDGEGQIYASPTAKYLILNDNFHILCDYHGLLHDIPEGPLSMQSRRKLQSIANASYYSVKKTHPHELVDAAHEEQRQNEEWKNAASVFELLREGAVAPNTLHVRGGRVKLDGVELSPEKAQEILEQIHKGKAKINYPNGMSNQSSKDAQEEAIAKQEKLLQDLKKAEEVADDLAHIKALEDVGSVPKGVYDRLRTVIYQDEMIPSIGNRRSFNQFMLEPDRGGVHIMIDGNNTKIINDVLGHPVGNTYITAIGNACRAAVDATVGPEKAKVHHLSGDEFHVHVPTKEDAYNFLRALREYFETIPKLGDEYKVSACAGVGKTPKEADDALVHNAKSAKLAHIVLAGGNPNNRYDKTPAVMHLYAHSALPDSEGPVDTGEAVPKFPPRPEATVPDGHPIH